MKLFISTSSSSFDPVVSFNQKMQASGLVEHKGDAGFNGDVSSYGYKSGAKLTKKVAARVKVFLYMFGKDKNNVTVTYKIGDSKKVSTTVTRSHLPKLGDTIAKLIEEAST